ncbi:molybdopterin-synthase adenylyltransferase MoeB [Gilvimarinus sp. F26214L]|uniref:molybdopterin-synthase adenylyltransferase MoeB n=1 Tax=Gilvimarinus sp. DZF01 TaxID=3461371 RepID=UPI0040452693
MKDEELLRYSRQILLPELDVDGQEKLLQSRVLIVGMGGLGSPVAMYLAAAGVGTLSIADFDSVELSNLQRQIIHNTASLGISKVDSATKTLAALNPDTRVLPIEGRLNEANLDAVVQTVDLVLDCTDNFSIRFALNRACVNNRVPLVSGAAIRLEGQVSVFDSRREDSPCYSCLYSHVDDEQLSCSQAGVLAPLVGIIGSMQATEAIKILAGFGEPLVGRLQVLDAKTMSWRELRLSKDPACEVCGGGVPHPATK